MAPPRPGPIAADAIPAPAADGVEGRVLRAVPAVRGHCVPGGGLDGAVSERDGDGGVWDWVAECVDGAVGCEFDYLE